MHHWHDPTLHGMLAIVHAHDRQTLAQRVARAAETAVREQGYATTIDVMLGIGWLQQSHLVEWRTQRLPCLEQGIQANPNKVAEAMRLFAAWARDAGLKPSLTEYVARTAGRERLRFSTSDTPAIEDSWRTHWVSPKLTDEQRTRVQEHLQKPPELIAVVARHADWRCHRCDGTGALLVMQPEGPACLQCAGLGNLEELPAGNALLTRRARAASKLTAVIVKWSKARKRNERVGILVEPEALATARASLSNDSERDDGKRPSDQRRRTRNTRS